MTIDSFSLQTTFCRTVLRWKVFWQAPYSTLCYSNCVARSVLFVLIRVAVQHCHGVKLAGSVTVNPWGQIVSWSCSQTRVHSSVNGWVKLSISGNTAALHLDYYLCWVNDRCRLTLKFKCRHWAMQQKRTALLLWDMARGECIRDPHSDRIQLERGLPASNYKNSSVPAIPCSSLQHTEYFRFQSLCPPWNLPVASCRFSPKAFHLWEHIDANIRNKPVIKEEGIGVHLRVSSSDYQNLEWANTSSRTA